MCKFVCVRVCNNVKVNVLMTTESNSSIEKRTCKK